MSASELSALAKDTLVPAADAGLVTKDQTGADRSGRQMGAWRPVSKRSTAHYACARGPFRPVRIPKNENFDIFVSLPFA